MPVSGGLTFAYLSTGTGITCGVTIEVAAYCWGGGGRGQFGHGKMELPSTTVRVADPQ